MRYQASLLICLAVCLSIYFRLCPTASRLLSPWGWTCKAGTCVKKNSEGMATLMTLNTCKLTCGSHGVLWPRPSNATVGSEVATFLPTNVTFTPTCGGGPEACGLLDQAVAVFQDNLHRYHPDYSDGMAPWEGPWNPSTPSHSLHLDVTVSGNDNNLMLETDESYELAVTTSDNVTTATIIAPTYFGARHALETLSQLVEFHETEGSLMLVTLATISDAPAFKYRGLLLDTARNFMSIRTLKRTLDAMAATKLNTLHLHLTDSQAFPIYLPGLPNMAYYGAYTSRDLYSPEDIRNLQQYARVRGIRLVPELDAPAHVGNGWQWGPKEGLGNLAVCIKKEPWKNYCLQPPCGQLNIANPKMYTVLGQIYSELFDILDPIEIFHYGGDEVNTNCWNTTEEVVQWMKSNNFSLSNNGYYEQWGVFQEKSRLLVAKASIAKGTSKPYGLIWQSALTKGGRWKEYIDPTKYFIQLWYKNEELKSEGVDELLKHGYKLIFTNNDAWFLDCGAGSWVNEGGNWCQPYREWQTVYNNSPHDIANQLTGSPYTEAILGGEAALWSEQVDDQTVDAKLWPRGAALGERLWTNPTTNWRQAEIRFIHHRQRLVQRGIRAERIQPQWCHQNDGLCYS